MFDIVTSIDDRGVMILWKLTTGEIVQILNTKENSAYCLCPFDPQEIFVSYIRDSTVFLEVIEPFKFKTTITVEKVLTDNEYISYDNFPTFEA